MASTLEQNMKATTEAFILSFDGAWKLGATMAQRAPICQHSMLPASLGMATKNNEKWNTHFENVVPLDIKGTMVIQDYLPVPSERRAVAYSVFDGTTKVGAYHNEYVWFFKFDESGEKIVDIKEFFDSKAASEMLAKVNEYKEKQTGVA